MTKVVGTCFELFDPILDQIEGFSGCRPGPFAPSAALPVKMFTEHLLCDGLSGCTSDVTLVLSFRHYKPVDVRVDTVAESRRKHDLCQEHVDNAIDSIRALSLEPLAPSAEGQVRELANSQKALAQLRGYDPVAGFADANWQMMEGSRRDTHWHICDDPDCVRHVQPILRRLLRHESTTLAHVSLVGVPPDDWLNH